MKDAVIKSIRVVLKKKSGIVLSENEKIYLNMDKEAMESICYYLRLIEVLQGDDESGKLFRFQDDM